MDTIDMPNALYESRLTALDRVSQGKVRDIYAIDDEHLLIVTTDRLSAFDVVLPDPIPGKGEVLTRLSNFWFGRTTDIVDNHLSDLSLEYWRLRISVPLIRSPDGPPAPIPIPNSRSEYCASMKKFEVTTPL